MNDRSKQETVAESLSRSQRKLYAVVFSLIGNEQDAMDVLQDANAAILAHASQFDPARPIAPWLKAFAIQQVMIWRRDKARERVLFDSDTTERLAEEMPEDESGHAESDTRHLQTCLAKLKSWQRALLHERYEKRTPVGLLAKLNNVSRISLSVAMFRLRKTLRSCIENERQKAETQEEERFTAVLEEFFDKPDETSARQRLAETLAHNAEFRAIWLEQSQLHAMLSYGRCKRKQHSAWRIVATAAALLCAFAAYAYFHQDKDKETTATEVHTDAENTQEQVMTKPALAIAALATVANATELFWTGEVDGNWSTAGNWKDGSGNAVAWQNGAVARFDDEARAFTVNLTQAVEPAGIVVSNTTAYTFSGGTGKNPMIRGTGGLVKKETGLLLIDGMHSFTGDVDIWEGQVQNATTGLTSGTDHDAKDSTWSFLGNPRAERTCNVYTNGVLYFGGDGYAANGALGNGHSTMPKMKLNIAGGTISFPNGGFLGLGNVVFENATIVLKKGLNGTIWPSGSIGGKAEFRGDTPYRIILDGAALTAMATPSAGLLFSSNMDASPTILDVPDISGDASSDVILHFPLRTTPRFSGGFTKIGDGTLELNCYTNTFTGDIRIEEGVLFLRKAYSQHSGVNGTWGVLGNPTGTHTVYIGPKAEIFLNTSDLMGMVYNTGNWTLHIDGGKLSEGNNVNNPLANCIFENVQWNILNGNGFSWPHLAFNNTVRFTGTNVVTVPFMNNGAYLFGADKMVDWIVDDVTSDEKSDLIWKANIANFGNWAGVGWHSGKSHVATKSQFRKKGAGTLEFADYRMSYTGNVEVAEGTWRINASVASSPENPTSSALGNPMFPNRTITVLAGGTLEYARADVMGHAYSQPEITTIIDGGTFRIPDGGNQNQLGNLVLNNATLDFGANTANGWGTSEFGALVSWNADAVHGAYDIPTTGQGDDKDYFGLGFQCDMVKEIVGTKTNFSGFCEWHVADITGDDTADVTWRRSLRNMNNSRTYGRPVSGLKKTGAGTLRLTTVCTYTGATKVQEGSLLVDGSLASDVTVSAGAFFGGAGSVANVTLEEGAGLEASFSQTEPLNIATLATSGDIPVRISGIPSGTRNFRIPVARVSSTQGTVRYIPSQNNVKLVENNGVLTASRTSGTIIMLLGD